MKTIRSLALLLAVALAAAASAQTTLYWGGGTTDKSDGGPLPNTQATANGTWDDSTLNWSNQFSPTVYQSWSTGAVANFGYSTGIPVAISVSGNKAISGFFVSLTPANATSAYQFSAPAAGTQLQLTGSSVRFLISSGVTTRGVSINTSGSNLTLAGNATLVKDGNGYLELGGYSSSINMSAFTGSLLVRHGGLALVGNPGSIFTGITNATVTGYRASWRTTNANGAPAFSESTLALYKQNSSTDQFSNNLAVTLARGKLDLRNGGTNATETIGSITFEGAGIIGNNQGIAGAIWNVGSLSRGANGRGTAIMQVNATTGAGQHEIRITNPGSIPTDTLLPWFSTNRGEWLLINSTANNRLERVASTTADTNVSNWNSLYGPGTNLRVPASALSGSLGANLALNSLGFLGASSAQILDLGGYTLTLNAGALGLSPNANIQTEIRNGALTTPSGTALYINTGWNNTHRLTINAVISGQMDIYITGQTDVRFGPDSAGSAPANTYNGTIYVNSGTLQINKDNAVTGPLWIGTGGGAVINRTAGITSSSTATITVEKEGILFVNASAPTFNGVVTVNGGHMFSTSQGWIFTANRTGLNFNGGVMWYNHGSATREIVLNTNVSYASTSEMQAEIRQLGAGPFRVALSNATSGSYTRTFDIADSTLHNQAEMLIDVPIINSSVSGSATGGITKTGAGTLQLTAANTYTGPTTVNGGTLHLARINVAGQTGLSGTFHNTGGENDILTFLAPITGTMAVGQTVSGTNITSGRIAKILNDYQVILTSSGVGTAANQTQSDIAVSAIDKIGSLQSAVTVNNGGRLLMDTGTLVNNTVTVNSGGVLAGTGLITGATTITGSLQPGHSIGTKTVQNNVTWNPSTDAADAWVFELGTPALTLAAANAGGSTQDLLNITSGDFNKGSGSGSFLFNFAGTGAQGWYKLVDWTGSTTFSASDFSYTNLASGYTASFTVDSATSALYLNVIPEPATVGLLVAGVALLALRRRIHG